MAPRLPKGLADPSRFPTAEAAEAHFLRMWRLNRMDPGELATLLSGPREETRAWIESAARYGVTEAQLQLGQLLLDDRDELAALRWFRRAARSSPEAMNMVGRCMENGWGATQDLEDATRWYLRSAEAGHDWGQYNYANMLFSGRGIDLDQAEAVVWYRKAAARGHSRAMNLLARCREEGWGAERDPVEAYRWYRRSAEAGYFRAQFNLGTILTGQGQIEEALDWFKRACDAAMPDSRDVMVHALASHANPKISRLGRTLRDASPRPRPQ